MYETSTERDLTYEPIVITPATLTDDEVMAVIVLTLALFIIVMALLSQCIFYIVNKWQGGCYPPEIKCFKIKPRKIKTSPPGSPLRSTVRNDHFELVSLESEGENELLSIPTNRRKTLFKTHAL